MPIVSRIWKVGGKTALHPAPLARAATEAGWPMEWWGKVNSVVCPRGRKPGFAYFLLSGEDKRAMLTDAAISEDATVNIVNVHENGTTTWVNYYPIACEVATKKNDDPPYFVTFADCRWVLDRCAVNRRFNLRNGAGASDYVQSTTDGGTPWTWQQVVDELWAELPAGIAGASPALPFSPTSTPENLIFEGVSCWRSINQVLTAIGCASVLDPFTGDFSVVNTNDTATVTPSGIKLWDFDAAELKPANYPATVKVSYPTLPGLSSEFDPFNDEVHVEESDLGQDGAAGSTYAIADTPFFTGTNAADLQTRADEIRDALIGLLKPMAKPWGMTYSGIIEFIPNEDVTSILWQTDGTNHGTVTTILNTMQEIDWIPVAPFNGPGAWGEIEATIVSLRTASSGVPEEAPYTGLTIATCTVQGTSPGRDDLIGTEVDVVDHSGCVFNLTEAELIDVWIWAAEKVFPSLDPEADPGDLTPVHWSAFNRCCN